MKTDELKEYARKERIEHFRRLRINDNISIPDNTERVLDELKRYNPAYEGSFVKLSAEEFEKTKAELASKCGIYTPLNDGNFFGKNLHFS